MLKFLLFFSVCLFLSSNFIRAEERADILSALNALPGVAAEEKTTRDDTGKDVRRFSVTIEQPLDHFHPKAGSFHQKLVLFHRGYSEPMLLQTSGYSIFGARLARLASFFGTNQIQVEHRFFGESVPEKIDWNKLTVRQSAEDFHHIVETFKKVYPAHWVNTGASKGGMTSVFHRRFYPADLDGTVADVAPFSYALDDARYIDFVDKVGGADYSACREQLYALQQILLRRGEEIMPEIEGSFEEVGDKLIAYETAVVEMPFVFWQYGDPTNDQWGCSSIPGASESAHNLANFLKVANNPGNYGDAELTLFRPYFYQSAVELGAPGAKLSHLKGLLKYPYVLEPFLPKNVKTHYSNAAMLDMRNWAAKEAKSVMFVYGEFDPWSAGAFTELNSAENADNHAYVVPGGNHGSNFSLLAGEKSAEAIALLTRWFNKAPAKAVGTEFGLKSGEADDSLEALELKALRNHRLQ